MRRRSLLATVPTAATAALAGCAGVTERLTGRGGAEAPTARFVATPVSVGALPAAVLPVFDEHRLEDHVRLLERILDGGATTTGVDPPLVAGRHLLYEDAVYVLSADVVERTPATRFAVSLTILASTPAPSSVVHFSDLPAVDREALAGKGLVDGRAAGTVTTLLYTDAERERSTLVPTSAYDAIEWPDGERAGWTVDDGHDTTLNTYRYAAAAVASRREYGRRLRDRFAFELSGLGSGARSIVETTVAGETFVVEADATPSPGFRTLVERFRDHEQVHPLNEAGEDDLSGSYLVRYEGGLYVVDLLVYDRSLAGTPRETLVGKQV